MGITIKIKIVAARNLPVMDKTHNLTDAYVEVRFGSKTEYWYKTNVCRKTLNPTWNQQFRIEIPDYSYFLDNIIELRIWDYDLVGSNDIIGFTFIDPSVLIGEVSSLEGWLPIFDSLRGLCGDIYVSVKLEFFDNLNPFDDASLSVNFFSVGNQQAISQHKEGYHVQVQNMVEELLVDDDPEHDWRDTFRSSRTSNEQRVLLLYKLSSRVRRQMGKRVEELGGNVVLGYYELFDLEENSDNIIVRALGTACKVMPEHEYQQIQNSIKQREISPHAMSISPTLYNMMESKLPYLPQNHEVHLCTLKLFDPFTIKNIGGVVSSRSIKLIKEMKQSVLAKQRDVWWNELREEIKGHARSLKCTHIIGYSESTVFHNDLCILSAIGTAANLRSEETPKSEKSCEICHTPYTLVDSPFDMESSKCAICKQGNVPDVLLTTIEVPNEFIHQDRTCFIEARISRPKHKKQGEANAKLVSDILPFVEYDLNKQLLHKMRIQGVNSAFNLHYNIIPCETHIIATVTATGVYASALPPPTPLEFQRSLQIIDAEDKMMFETQQKIQKISEYNSKKLMLSKTPSENIELAKSISPPTGTYSDSSELSDGVDQKDAFVVNIDDDTDEDNMAVLLDPLLPNGLAFSNLRANLLGIKPHCNLQNIIIQRRYSLKSPQDKFNQYLCSLYHDIYSSLAFKLRWFFPCAVCGIRSEIQLLDREYEIQISLQAMVLLMDSDHVGQDPEILEEVDVPKMLPSSIPTPKSSLVRKVSNKDLLFEMDDDLDKQKQLSPPKKLSVSDNEDTTWMKKVFVTTTPLWFVPGAKIKRMISRLSKHFIRERVDVFDYGAFVQQTLMEVNSIISAHAAAIGANALINYHVHYHDTSSNPARKHAYMLITVYGDAVELEYTESGLLGLKSISTFEVKYF